MPTLSYEGLLRTILPRLSGGIQWGLERTRRMLADSGDPHLRYPVIHVGGTNGKGSVAANIESVLRARGFRTGLYTSPHLCTFRERIRLDGRAIESRPLLAAVEPLWPFLEREAPSFFEAATVLAFAAFARAEVDVAVVEVGLGGRLDATNVVSPVAVVVTNVALDHGEYLGTTLEAVAREKAGIFKAGVPALTAETDPSALRALRSGARAAGTPLLRLRPSELRDVEVGAGGAAGVLRTRSWGEIAFRTPLTGHHQVMNAALAIRALETLPDPIRPDRKEVLRGVAGVRWPGRFHQVEVAGTRWIFDVAHNPAAVAALCATLDSVGSPRPRALLLGILGDKDWRAMIPPLLDRSDAAIATVPPSAPAERAWDPAAVAALFPGRLRVEPDFRTALSRAAALAGSPDREPDGSGSVLVTGSFHTVGDAMALLGRAPEGLDAPLPAAVDEA